nr:MAG TPA: ATPase [Caudoviricetes sp.]
MFRKNRYAENFRYLLLKCVDRWNVYFNTLLIVALFFSL